MSIAFIDLLKLGITNVWIKTYFIKGSLLEFCKCHEFRGIHVSVLKFQANKLDRKSSSLSKLTTTKIGDIKRSDHGVSRTRDDSDHGVSRP